MATEQAASAGVAEPGRAAGRRRWWRRAWWTLAAVVLIVVAGGVVLLAKAAAYQPLGWGSTGNSAELYPGLPAGKGIHAVNTVGLLHYDIYIPPQAGVFSLFVDIRNNGSRAVVIEAVSIQKGNPIWSAGSVRYSTPGMGRSIDIPPPTSRVLHDVRLGPGREMYIGLPVRTAPCVITNGWTAIPSFYVKYRFLFFTRTVAIPWSEQGGQLILNMPGQPGHQSVRCAR